MSAVVKNIQVGGGVCLTLPHLKAWDSQEQELTSNMNKSIFKASAIVATTGTRRIPDTFGYTIDAEGFTPEASSGNHQASLFNVPNQPSCGVDSIYLF